MNDEERTAGPCVVTASARIFKGIRCNKNVLFVYLGLIYQAEHLIKGGCKRVDDPLADGVNRRDAVNAFGRQYLLVELF